MFEDFAFSLSMGLAAGLTLSSDGRGCSRRPLWEHLADDDDDDLRDGATDDDVHDLEEEYDE